MIEVDEMPSAIDDEETMNLGRPYSNSFNDISKIKAAASRSTFNRLNVRLRLLTLN